MRIFFLLTLLFAGLFFQACNSDQRKTKKQAPPTPVVNQPELDSTWVSEKNHQLDSAFNRLYKKWILNGNVLIARKGEIILKKSYGYSDLRKKTPLDTNSTFQLASVSKQFTAAAILLLYQRGELDFSCEVTDFFPEFPYDNITIKQLLTHRSGLPNYMYFCDHYCCDRTSNINNIDVIRMMVNNQPEPYYHPGRRYDYSNTGYCLLASIVEKLSNKSYEEFMLEDIFRPLGMTSTYIYDYTKNTEIPNAVLGYASNGRIGGYDYLDGVMGDKGIYSTLDDLFKWDQVLYSDTFLHQQTLAEAFTPWNFDMKGDLNYGYGWRIFTSAEKENTVYHAGWWRGFQSYFLRRMSDSTTVIILRNKVNLGLNNYDFVLDILDQ